MKRLRPTCSMTAAVLLTACAIGCGGSPAVATPPAEAPAAPASTAEAATPAKTPEQLKAEEDAKKLEAEFAEMEKLAASEKERLASETEEKAAQALVDGVYASTKAALEAAAKGTHRAPGNADRDAVRHPVETLELMGLRAKQTVVEYGPGAGWYTEFLAPTLAKSGQLYVTNGDPNGPRTERSTFYAKRTQLFLDSSKTLYGKVKSVDPKEPGFELGLDGQVDLVFVARGIHGMINRDQLDARLASFHAALKPGGTLGIVQHRAKEGADPKASAKDGYVPEKWLIEKVKSAGFELAGQSEVNANPKDTKDYPEGVWTLPPTLRLGDTDRAKYEAIGESDRMTLKFKKIAK